MESVILQLGKSQSSHTNFSPRDSFAAESSAIGSFAVGSITVGSLAAGSLAEGSLSVHFCRMTVSPREFFLYLCVTRPESELGQDFLKMIFVGE